METLDQRYTKEYAHGPEKRQHNRPRIFNISLPKIALIYFIYVHIPFLLLEIEQGRLQKQLEEQIKKIKSG